MLYQITNDVVMPASDPIYLSVINEDVRVCKNGLKLYHFTVADELYNPKYKIAVEINIAIGPLRIQNAIYYQGEYYLRAMAPITGNTLSHVQNFAYHSVRQDAPLSAKWYAKISDTLRTEAINMDYLSDPQISVLYTLWVDQKWYRRQVNHMYYFCRNDQLLAVGGFKRSAERPPPQILNIQVTPP